MSGIGRTLWIIPEGYIPDGSHGPPPEMTSHEAACMLNAGDAPADVDITIYFADRDPVGPYRVRIDPRRTSICGSTNCRSPSRSRARRRIPP